MSEKSNPIPSPVSGSSIGSIPVMIANMSVSTLQKFSVTSIPVIEVQAGTETQMSPLALRTSISSPSDVWGENSADTKPSDTTWEHSAKTGPQNSLRRE